MDKKTTQMIKGFAILVMIMHHFCARTLFPELDGVLHKFGVACKICVAIFAVLSGYGYYFAREKTVRYSLKKIWELLKIYWISLFTLFIPIAILGGWTLTPRELIVQLFGLIPNLNWFAWYVFFYIFCMMVMPYVHRIFRYGTTVNLGIALVVPYAFEVVLHSIPNYENSTTILVLFSCFLYLPCFLIGYLVAKHKLMEIANSRIYNRKSRVIISIIVLICVFAARYLIASIFGFLLDVLYAPLLIWCLANIYDVLQIKLVQATFLKLGKYSTGIWFFHAVFFSTYVSEIFQPILLLIKQPVFMYIWLVVLSLLGAYSYQRILDGLQATFMRVRRS